MSQPDDESQEALKRLHDRLDAFDGGGRDAKGLPEASAERSMGEGYRLLGEVVSGVLGGIGLGWVVDHFAHTTPFGLVIGMLLGTAASAYVAMKSADRMGRSAAEPDPRKGKD